MGVDFAGFGSAVGPNRSLSAGRVSSVGQEPPDDERDLFRREFLLSNLQRIRLALERDPE
jgi:hypothetical protein